MTTREPPYRGRLQHKCPTCKTWIYAGEWTAHLETHKVVCDYCGARHEMGRLAGHVEQHKESE